MHVIVTQQPAMETRSSIEKLLLGVLARIAKFATGILRERQRDAAMQPRVQINLNKGEAYYTQKMLCASGAKANPRSTPRGAALSGSGSGEHGDR